jgi:hypothetical protein
VLDLNFIDSHLGYFSFWRSGACFSGLLLTAALHKHNGCHDAAEVSY